MKTWLLVAGVWLCVVIVILIKWVDFRAAQKIIGRRFWNEMDE